MVVPLIVVVTVVVFVLVDFALRKVLQRARQDRLRKEREEALDSGLKLDVSEEAPTLTRVEVANPKARILAVDDEKPILDSFRKMLVLAGYSIDTVEKGSEALGLIRKNDYDFVFTDLKMPEMDGVEVTKAVKHLRPDIDVIVITGYGSIETAVETVKVGAMDYVQKPFTEDELLAFVRRAVIKREANLERHMRHKIRILRPGTGESHSRFELNVPAGIFISPQHAWAKIESSGIVRVGPDDLLRKIFNNIDAVKLPETGHKVARGETLCSLKFGGHSVDIPAPVSGVITAVNTEHAERPEWLAIKPFKLSWMCAIEPTNLAAELPDLKLGRDSVSWYQEEIDRYEAMANKFLEETAQNQPADTKEGEAKRNAEFENLLAGFSKTFRQAESPD